MSEVIVITSGKGGVGKTTTTANLGVGLAMRGKKVALVDTDTGLRNLDLLLGLERRIVYTLVDVVQKRVGYGKSWTRALPSGRKQGRLIEIGRASCRERV